MNTEKEMAMFRYSVINPLLHGGGNRSLKKRMSELADRIWTLPDGKLRQFSWGTIEDWYYTYRNYGFAGLVKQQRKDNGKFRMLDDETCLYIDRFIKNYPQLKTSAMIFRMRNDAEFGRSLPSESTIYRYMRTVRPRRAIPTKERRAFEAPYAGSLWQTDIMYGPYLPQLNDRGKWVKKQTFLVAIIDDHSRLLCHGEFYFSQDILAYLGCLKTALCKRGIPEKLYCDNGKVFLSDQVKNIMAELGTTVLHTAVRDAAAKGKIERYFRTVRDSFLNPLLALEPPRKLEELNKKFWKWCEESYNLKVHSAINGTPIERWMNTSHKVRLLNIGTEDEIFQFEEIRKVKKDGTFSLKNTIYETSWTLAGKKISVRYNPFFPEQPYVSFEGEKYGKANLLNRNFNNKAPRKSSLEVN
jgi:transposase InsO family protein